MKKHYVLGLSVALAGLLCMQSSWAETADTTVQPMPIKPKVSLDPASNAPADTTTDASVTPNETATAAATSTSTATATQAAEPQSVAEANTDVSAPVLIKLATDATIAVFNYDYQNYEKRFDVASKYFTKEGWMAFDKALKASNNLAAVTADQMQVTAKITGEAKLVKQAVVNGERTWQILVPVSVNYAGQQQQLTQDLEVNITLVPVATDVNPQGLAITQFIAKVRPSDS